MPSHEQPDHQARIRAGKLAAIVQDIQRGWTPPAHFVARLIELGFTKETADRMLALIMYGKREV